MEKMNINQAKTINLVSYLSDLGFKPVKVRGSDYWYLSPLRNEHTASFKVDNKRNLWYDHGTGKGGDLISFGTQFFNCSVSDLLSKLSESTPGHFIVHPQKERIPVFDSVSSQEANSGADSKIEISSIRSETTNPVLLWYLKKRCIPVTIANRYCHEVDFQLYGKQRTAIGFPNNSGGYELRNAYFKGSSSPKDISLFSNGGTTIKVFEGFFDFLSFVQLNQVEGKEKIDFLILNTLAYLEKSRNIMDGYTVVDMFLDNDKSGQDCTMKAKEWNMDRYKDHSPSYRPDKDLNEKLYRQQSKKRILRP